jgi:hypothetical protein
LSIGFVGENHIPSAFPLILTKENFCLGRIISGLPGKFFSVLGYECCILLGAKEHYLARDLNIL